VAYIFSDKMKIIDLGCPWRSLTTSAVGYPSDSWACCNLSAYRRPTTRSFYCSGWWHCMKTGFTVDICAALLATDLDLPLWKHFRIGNNNRK